MAKRTPPEVTKRALIEAGLRVALRDGLANVSNSTVSLAAERTSGTVSNYFYNGWPGMPGTPEEGEKTNLKAEVVREALAVGKVSIVDQAYALAAAGMVKWPDTLKRHIADNRRSRKT